MRQLQILIVIIFLTIMASSGCFIPEEPVQEVDLSKGPPKPPMDLDKPPPEEASLIERMGYEDKDVIYAAYDELIAMGKDAVPILVEEGLKHEDPGIRDASASTLGKIGPDAADAVPALIEALDDEYSQVQQTAVEAIGKIGASADESIPALIGLFSVDSMQLAKGASRALAEIGTAAIPALIEILKSNDSVKTHYAIETLEHMGHSASDAIGPLIELLRTTPVTDLSGNLLDGEVFLALGADVSIGPLISVLKDENVNGANRSLVINILCRFGSEAMEDFPILVELLDSNDFDISFDCFMAIASKKMDPEFSVSVLSRYLNDEDEFLRGMAAASIGGFGVIAEGALPKLREIVEHDPDKEVREGARISIKQIEFELRREEAEGKS